MLAKKVKLVFMSSDGMRLYRKPDGSFLVKNVSELLSIAGCIMINQNTGSSADRKESAIFLKILKQGKIYSTETGKLITQRW